MGDQKSAGADVARPALPRDTGPALPTVRASKDINPAKKKKPVTDEERREREVNRKLQHQLISHWRMDRKSSRERSMDGMPSSKFPRIVGSTPKAAMNPANALKDPAARRPPALPVCGEQ